MFQSMAKTLKLPMAKFYVTLHKYGNISSASCAIAFDEAARDGSVKKAISCAFPFRGRPDLGKRPGEVVTAKDLAGC